VFHGEKDRIIYEVALIVFGVNLLLPIELSFA
jgi:hypothetical protein